jgi:lipid-A-disaccharide synthase-like uncharacterized protein
VVAALLLMLVACTAAADDLESRPTETPRIELRIKVDQIRKVELARGDDGQWVYLLIDDEGRQLTETPQQFSARLYSEYAGRSWLHRLFNISGTAGIAWVAFGFLGQFLFTGRMIVQWLVSEKHRKSTIPVVFWYMSLAGGTMLLIYFIWRRDIVGICGQATGVFIYLRNLVLIRRHRVGEAVRSGE